MNRGILSFGERLALAWDGLCMGLAGLWQASAPMRRGLDAHGRMIRAWPLCWLWVYGLVLAGLCFWLVDRPLAKTIKAHMGGNWEGFFSIVTELGRAEIYLVPSALLCLGLVLASIRPVMAATRQHLRRLAVAPGFVFVSIALSGLISNAIKISAGRYRPRYLFDQDIYGFSPFNTQWGMNSFPSGHTQAAFAAMTALTLLFPRHVALWLTIAFLVAFSRVALTVHFLSDTMIGGCLAVWVTVLLHRWLQRKNWM